MSTLSDAELLAILAGPNVGRTADAVLDECGAVRALPHKSAGDLARIDGVTPKTAASSRLRSGSAVVRSEARTVERPGLDGFGARMDPRRGSEFQLAWTPGQDETDGRPGRSRRLPGRSGRPGFWETAPIGAS